MDSGSFFCILTFSYSSTICGNAILSSLYCLCIFAEKQLSLYMYGFVSGFSILFHSSTCLPLCQYHAVLNNVAL